jgi:hypothetical protein
VYIYHADSDSFLLQLYATSPVYVLYTGLPPSNDDQFDKNNHRNDDGNNGGNNNNGKGSVGGAPAWPSIYNPWMGNPMIWPGSAPAANRRHARSSRLKRFPRVESLDWYVGSTVSC